MTTETDRFHAHGDPMRMHIVDETKRDDIVRAMMMMGTPLPLGGPGLLEQFITHRASKFDNPVIITIVDIHEHATDRELQQFVYHPGWWKRRQTFGESNLQAELILGADTAIVAGKFLATCNREREQEGWQRAPRHRRPSMNVTLRQHDAWYALDYNIITDADSWCTMIAGTLGKQYQQAGFQVIFNIISNDLLIAPCCDPPAILFTTGIGKKGLRTRLFEYSQQLNDSLYTLRLLYDDTSYIFQHVALDCNMLWNHREDDKAAIAFIQEMERDLLNRTLGVIKQYSDEKKWYIIQALENLTMIENYDSRIDESGPYEMMLARARGLIAITAVHLTQWVRTHESISYFLRLATPFCRMLPASRKTLTQELRRSMDSDTPCGTLHPVLPHSIAIGHYIMEVRTSTSYLDHVVLFELGGLTTCIPFALQHRQIEITGGLIVNTSNPKEETMETIDKLGSTLSYLSTWCSGNLNKDVDLTGGWAKYNDLFIKSVLECSGLHDTTEPRPYRAAFCFNKWELTAEHIRTTTHHTVTPHLLCRA